MAGTFLRHVRDQWMGALALFLVLASGTAYAANTVFSSDIVDGQVKTPDLANAAVTTDRLAGGAVTTEKVKNDNLTGGDVAFNTLKGADVDESTLSNVGGGGAAGGALTGSYPNPEIAFEAVGGFQIGPEEVSSSDIALGAVGASELRFIGTVEAKTSVPAAGGDGSVSVGCPPGQKLIGGGAYFDFPSGEISATRNTGPEWFAEGQNNGTVAQDLTVQALCILPGL